MKKPSLIIVALTMMFVFSYAQKIKPNSIVKAKYITFKVDEVERHGDPTDGITIVNINNIYRERVPKISASSISLYEKIQRGSIIKSFKQVFNEDRLKQLIPEHGIVISMYITPLGKVGEVEFLLRKNTSVTVSELEQLETAIKNNVVFNIKPGETKGGDFFVIPLQVNYQNILDNIER